MTVLKVSSRLVVLKEMVESSLELSGVSFQQLIKNAKLFRRYFLRPKIENKEMYLGWNSRNLFIIMKF